MRRPKALKGANGAASERCKRVGREFRVLTAMRSRRVSEQNDETWSGGESAALGRVAYGGESDSGASLREHRRAIGYAAVRARLLKSRVKPVSGACAVLAKACTVLLPAFSVAF